MLLPYLNLRPWHGHSEVAGLSADLPEMLVSRTSGPHHQALNASLAPNRDPEQRLHFGAPFLLSALLISPNGSFTPEVPRLKGKHLPKAKSSNEGPGNFDDYEIHMKDLKLQSSNSVARHLDFNPQTCAIALPL